MELTRDKAVENILNTQEGKNTLMQAIKDLFVYSVQIKLNNRYYKYKYDVKDIEDFFDENREEQEKYSKQIIEQYSNDRFSRIDELTQLLVQKYIVLGKYEDTGEINEKQKPYEPTDEELHVMPLREAIVYLRQTRKSKDTFPWPLVERWIKEQDQSVNKRPDDLIDNDEYKWYWVDSMANLSGVGGWLQVDVINKKQGEFKFCCVS